MSETGHSFHQAAETAREQKQYPKALALYDQALLVYIEMKNYAGIAELFAGRSIVFRHLADQAQDVATRTLYLTQVEATVEQAVQAAKLAQVHGYPEGLALAVFNQAKYYEMVKNFGRAETLFAEALQWLEKYPPQPLQPAMVWDFKLKLALAQLESGDNQALTAVEAALAGLAAAPESDADYNIKVWRSGGYWHLANYFASKNLKKAQQYFEVGWGIIANDTRLFIRQEEYQKLAQKTDLKI